MKWLEHRRARKAAEEAARREAQERAWHNFWAAMHGATGGTPIPYPGDERRQP